jgi:predicted DNA-binding transcriptional regulator YafY
MARATEIQKAERLNLARTFLQQHDAWATAAEALARACCISLRQAYRYLEQARS